MKNMDSNWIKIEDNEDLEETKTVENNDNHFYRTRLERVSKAYNYAKKF